MTGSGGDGSAAWAGSRAALGRNRSVQDNAGCTAFNLADTALAYPTGVTLKASCLHPSAHEVG